MITINYNFTTGKEISYEEGLSKQEEEIDALKSLEEEIVYINKVLKNEI